ncbi:SWI/SNF-related matrix-associated actin-dependent regulator of chromatin subfamily A member 5 [Pancytospora philotis]|nr:SWI/SNF-related matrix-associated actin-dependent regulator of chromatin subfamily A member 5 [Pancytospora philotis]
MGRRTLRKYADFIDDTDFLRQFIPSLDKLLGDGRSADRTVPELYTFVQSPDYVAVKLRPYQLDGLNWLVRMHENGINCILADEMGLGKTLQSIALLGYIKMVRRERAKHLVIVPKSCLQNWKNEFARFVPELSVHVFHTSKSEVKAEAAAIFAKKIDVVLTTYEMCLFAKSAFKKIAWSYVVVDEAHRLKNENSQLSQILRMFRFDHRLLLTGTPLQNNIHELWALLNFIVPEIFADAENFEQYVLSADKDEDGGSIDKLRSVLQLFFLRREKADVEHSLLPKKVINLYCPLSDLQRVWYRSILSRDLTGVTLSGNAKASLLNIVMQLKKCCNHPYLFPGAEPEPFETGEHLVAASGKMVVLDKLLRSLRQKGSRVLIFSQMALMIDILEDYCNYRDYSYSRIDGKTTLAERTEAIEDYNRPGSDKFIFLLTTRAGGLGINLYTADTVVIFDSDWNPQADLQAQDRAHRIGQKGQVHVFRFITENSVEEGIVLRAQQKLKLDDILLQTGQKKTSASLTQGELMEILSAGLDAAAGTQADMSIEELLRRGEEKTQEMNERLDDFRIADTVTEGKIDLYQWEGENYARKRLSGFIDAERAARPARSNLFAARSFQPLVFPDYQFYPAAFFELQKEEEALVSKGLQLEEAQQAKKEELLSQGFNWTKRDYKAFLSAVDSCGNDLEKIKEQLPHRSDVEAYYRVFQERYGELDDAAKIQAIFDKARSRSTRVTKLRNIFEKHSAAIDDNIFSKNRLYTNNKRLIGLYAKYIDHPRCMEMIRADILADDEFMCDYFLLSRTPHELSKHISLLATHLIKSFDKK